MILSIIDICILFVVLFFETTMTSLLSTYYFCRLTYMDEDDRASQGMNQDSWSNLFTILKKMFYYVILYMHFNDTFFILLFCRMCFIFWRLPVYISSHSRPWNQQFCWRSYIVTLSVICYSQTKLTLAMNLVIFIHFGSLCNNFNVYY